MKLLWAILLMIIIGFVWEKDYCQVNPFHPKGFPIDE